MQKHPGTAQPVVPNKQGIAGQARLGGELKRIAVLTLFVAATSFVVNGAIAQNDSPSDVVDRAVANGQDAGSVYSTEAIRKATLIKPPPIRLPNIEAFVQKLKSADRSIAARQYVASRKTLAFWNNKGRWLRAPQRDKCAEVPWQRSCTIARASYRLHTKLAAVAEYRLIHELPNPNDWVTSVKIIQRVFPGTESWLLSCSDAEGGHGRFVIYGGRSYYPGAEHSYNGSLPQVGGPMQYMWGTFRGHYRRGLDALRARGFMIKMPDPDDVQAWLMPMGQAIAAGWARWSGNDDSHWSASFGNGC